MLTVTDNGMGVVTMGGAVSHNHNEVVEVQAASAPDAIAPAAPMAPMQSPQAVVTSEPTPGV